MPVPDIDLANPVDQTPAPPCHEIVWTHDRDSVTASAVCNDPDCGYRYWCTEGCEVLHGVERTATGWRHAVYDPDAPGPQPPVWHTMAKVDYCNVIEFLNADTSQIPELAADTDPFEIARTLIEPVWQGEDGLLWRRVVAP